ncbi:MAG TPA: hypothetical protein VHT52_21530 [Stellaceae bacterium]|nr:hypothetical protein [Stellaceae bacterium]
MDPAYNVIDSDGHILEPLNMWENYTMRRFASGRRACLSTKTAKSVCASTARRSVGEKALERSAR